MTLPVTGPYSWARDVHAPYWFGNPIRERFERNWSRQRKPYDLVLPYTYHHQAILSVWSSDDPESYSAAPSSSDQNFVDSYNKAYAKFKERIGDTSTWGVNLFEARQGLGMIIRRANQLRRFTRAVNRFDFPRASRELGMDFIPKGVKAKSKSFSNNWLEYHFGWEPLVKDIGAAVDVLQKPFPKRKVSGSGDGRVYSRTQVDNNYGPIEGSTRLTTLTEGKTSCLIAAVASVSNPNLYLANQLGFTNPASIAWELVPFSFVVDWFVNVGDILSSMTDFMGVSFEKSRVNFRSTIGRQYSAVRSGSQIYPNGIYDAFSAESFFFSRTGGLGTGPILSVKPFKGFSPVRGATAIALLVQQMK